MSNYNNQLQKQMITGKRHALHSSSQISILNTQQTTGAKTTINIAQMSSSRQTEAGATSSIFALKSAEKRRQSREEHPSLLEKSVERPNQQITSLTNLHYSNNLQ